MDAERASKTVSILAFVKCFLFRKHFYTFGIAPHPTYVIAKSIKEVVQIDSASFRWQRFVTN